MATQLHSGDQHLEVVAFAETQWQSARAAVGAMAALPLPERLAAYRRWDQEVPVPRKYQERICTGVDAQGDVPFRAAQPAVCDVWAAAAYDQAHQCALFGALACRSGERRGAVGYATNALLFGMNALLSSLRWPLLNKKWTLKRWELARSLFSDSPAMATLGEPMARAWGGAAARKSLKPAVLAFPLL